MKILKSVLNEIIEHSKRELPIEACGYLAGKDGIITKSYSLVNTDKSPEHFSFDPEEQFSVVRGIWGEGLQVIANYHSHPETPARPSQEDIKLAYDQNLLYFIVSLSNTQPDVKAFRIIQPDIEPIDLEIVENN